MLKVATIGGGSSYTPELVEGFIKRFDRFPIDELWLVDIEEGREKVEIVGALAQRMFEAANLPTKVVITMDRRAAIEGATFVTTQFRVGFLEARKWDERIPNNHQLLGQETNGFGGMFKAFRTIPIVLDIIKDVEELAPEAWVVNFANPAGIVTQAVQRFTNFKRFIGVCNVPIGMRFAIAKSFEVEVDDVHVDFLGLNHMVFGLKTYIKGEDKSAEAIEKFIAETASMANVHNIAFDGDFVRELGMLLCPYHRYMYKYSEMMDEQLEKFKDNHTRAEEVMEYEKSLFEKYKDLDLKEKPAELEKRGGAHYSDVACDVLASLYNDEGRIHTVNIVNGNQVKNLDPEDVIEITCKITKDGAIPLETITHLPREVRGIYEYFKSFELATCDAAFTGDYRKGILAANLNPFTRSDVLNQIVFKEMFAKHRKYLMHFTKNIPEDLK
ncbi:MAG: 6-phospho-beta-glucosidase [Mycoplasmatales bacterium]